MVRERSEERLAVEAKPGHGGRVLRNLAQLGLGVGAAVGIAWFLRSQTWVFHNSSGDWLVRAFSAVVALACFGAGLAAARRRVVGFELRRGAPGEPGVLVRPAA